MVGVDFGVCMALAWVWKSTLQSMRVDRGDVSSTRRALKPCLHLLQVSSQLLFQLHMLASCAWNCGVHACLWIGFVLLAEAHSQVSCRPRELGIGLLLVSE